MKKLPVILMALWAATAGANQKPEPPVERPAPQAQKQDQLQLQGQEQIQDQDQAQEQRQQMQQGQELTTGPVSVQNQVGINQTYKDRLQAPAVMAPSVYPSGSCAIGWSAGLGVPGAGASFGKTKVDPECTEREELRINLAFLVQLEPALALKVLCAQPNIAPYATEELCRPKKPQPEPGRLEQDRSGFATKEELRRAFEAATSK